MRLTSFVVSRSWASNNALRPALSILGVGLGIAIVIAIHVLDHNTVAAERRRAARAGGADLEVAPLDPARDPAAAREELLRIEGVSAVTAILVVPARVLAPPGGDGIETLTLFGVEPAPPGPYVVESGEALDPAGDASAVLVGAALASSLGLSPGGRLVLGAVPGSAGLDCEQSPPAPRPEPPPLELAVRGLVSEERLGGERGGRVALARLDTARRLAPGVGVVFHMTYVEGANPARIESAIARGFVVSGRRDASLGDAADQRAFRNGVKVLGLLALVLGMFVIFNTLSQTLVERLKRIGLLRSLGATGGDVARIVLADAAVLSLLGAGAGVAMGLLLAKLLIRFRITTLGLGKKVPGFDVPLGPVAAITALGVAFTLAGALLPLLKARKLSPLAILAARDLRPPADLLSGVNVLLFALLLGALPVAYLAASPLLQDRGSETLVVMAQAGGILVAFFGMLLVAPGLVRRAGGALAALAARALPLPVFLVRRELARSPGRVAASVCGLSAVCLAIVTLHSVTSALRGEAVAFGTVALRDRLFVRCDPIEPAAAREALAPIEGVRRVVPLVSRPGAPYDVVGLDLGGPLREERGAIVSTRLAALKGLSPGDPIRIPGPCGVGEFRVAAIDDAAGGSFAGERAFVAMDVDWVRRDTGAAGADRIVIEVEPGTDWSALVRAVRANLPGLVWMRSGWSMEKEEVAEIDRDFVIFDVLLLLILALAGVGLVNAMTIAALARTKELGVLAALGLSRRDLFSIFAVEAGVVGALAGAAAVALALPIAALVVRGLRAVSGLDVPFAPPWGWIAAVPLIAFATALAASAIPAARLARISPARAVRYE